MWVSSFPNNSFSTGDRTMSVLPILVFGNVNDDVTLCIGEPYHDAGLFGPDRAIGIIGSQLLVKENGILSVPYEGGRVLFSLKSGAYDPGKKCTAKATPTVNRNCSIEQIAKCFGIDVNDIKLSVGQSAWPLPGGGATNIGRGIYRVFRGLQYRTLVATCSQLQVEDFRKKLASVWGGAENLIFYPLDIPIGVNVILEGLGTSLDRNIFRGSQIRNAVLKNEWAPVSSAGVHLVNTIYNDKVAIYALTEAMRAEAMIIACTESLCADDAIDASLDAELVKFVNNHLGLIEGMGIKKIGSVHKFLQNFVLPNARKTEIPQIWIFNETEFGHFLEALVWMQVGNQGKHIINTQEILKGFKTFRQFEHRESGKVKSVIFVTCGNLGAFALDSNDNLHFCSVLDLKVPVQEKNAIGDLFASIILGVVAGGICDRAKTLSTPSKNPSGFVFDKNHQWVAYALLAASAAADSGVYDGFRHVTVANLNARLSRKAENYAYLGHIDAVLGQFQNLGKNLDLESFVCNQVPKMKPAVFDEDYMPGMKALVDPSVLSS